MNTGSSIDGSTGKAKKAAMLSGLVLPGLGQIYLGKRGKGGAIAASVVAFLAYFLYKIYVGFSNYFSAFLDPNLGFDTSAAKAPESLSSAFLKGVFFGALPVVIIWVYSAMDAYKEGMRADERERAKQAVLTGRH